MLIEDLKSEVIKLLIDSFEFTLDEAEEAVNSSYESRPEIWSEKAEPSDLAKFLASEDEDD